MLTEYTNKARARRVSALETVETRRSNAGMPQFGSSRQSTAAGLAFKSCRS